MSTQHIIDRYVQVASEIGNKIESIKLSIDDPGTGSRERKKLFKQMNYYVSVSNRLISNAREWREVNGKILENLDEKKDLDKQTKEEKKVCLQLIKEKKFDQKM